MVKLPKALSRLVELLQRLPGVGPKSAARLVFYLLRTPREFNNDLALAISDLKEKVKICQICFGVSEEEKCAVCSDKNRDRSQLCVVERADDVLSFEAIGGYRGVYHVLGGVINPLDHVGPEDIKIVELLDKVRGEQIQEIIIATNLTMEGEATALYIKKKIENLNFGNLKITRIGSGLPMGADLGFADLATLEKALEGRRVW
ncbi:recombination protein RecR [Candidatus Shapirobacteria bacterium CG06_land_8_20_14_3_00_40_12]|uniref:Recombination protein RecR n=2 Tax=Candidatus Shapironibacteriota TaxID=1752721 RepID=A0A2M7TS56_9BACT|nr:MAG: recombination protein RecR [Candidatus Shapirobacteria bacterium CG06_land_8_20_14_3_00_40_12]PIZ58446.1 MAG: recombination protein RecR [Candidatus Shapirobacteria bacterium CG_4_10_14_0_2_um_filter_40_12]